MNPTSSPFLAQAHEYLDARHPEPLARFLRERGQLEPQEAIHSVAPAGEGNMNLTLRVTTSRRSLVVKQARPWVEKYPTIAAPVERADSEAAFYRLVMGLPAVAARMPRLLDYDPERRVLLLEDLGVASDYTGLYRGETLTPHEAATLAHWLSLLHAARWPTDVVAGLSNLPLRQLNHEHVFHLPLSPGNSVDLDAITPGLRAIAVTLAADQVLRDAIAALGELYLSGPAERPSLLHGDFFPGSWLRTPSGPAVIDPEFAFFGPAEWDVGVFLAHLTMAGQPAETVAAARRAYQPEASFDWSLAKRFAAVEVVRRLVGVAQLPLRVTLDEKRRLLEDADGVLVSRRDAETQRI